MADELKTKKITDLEENTTIDDTDILMAGDKGTNALKRFTVAKLFDAIKTKITGWAFDTLTTTDKTLPGAVNELNSNAFKIRGNLNSGMAIENMKNGLYSAVTDLPDWYKIRYTDSNLNHTGIYLYSKGKIMIHLTFDYQSDEGCTTPGQYLRYHRTFQGLTTRELAEKVGVVPATLVLYENDRHPIKHSTAVALANVLGIDRSRLLDEYTVFVDYPYSSLLKKVRRELSFTQMQMAEVIGIGQTTYSGWEREVRVPRRKEHEKILAAMKKLKVDVDTYLCQPNPL